MGHLFNNPVSRVVAYYTLGAYSRGALNGNIALNSLHCVLAVIHVLQNINHNFAADLQFYNV